jgi:phosphatidylglycerophosphate synthase
MPDRKPRYGIELVCELVFRPVAHVLARALAPLRVPPPAVVCAATAAGLAAAVEIGRGSLIAGAVLLQLKTLLDNADGQLARLTNRVSAFGRYLDSESDLLVDAAVFAALGIRIGPWLALAGFVALTLVLSLNFNVERLYRRSRGERAPVAPPAPDRRTRVLARLYDVVYAPQDRLVEAAARRRPDAWHEPLAVQVLANFGLSTQLTALGVCLVLGRPEAYVLALVACVTAVAVLALRRERIVRRAVPALD